MVHIYRAKEGKLVYDTKAGGISPVTMADESLLKLSASWSPSTASAGSKNIMADAFA